jgi:tryptophan halogenase
VIGMRSMLLSQTLTESHRQPTVFQVDLFNKHHARLWDAIRQFLACHYKFNHHLTNKFWRCCQNETDLAGAQPMVEYYQKFGPTGIWGPMLLDPLDPFGSHGYLTILVGQQVPYERKYTPTQAEWDTWNKVRRHNAESARRAMTVPEALGALGFPLTRAAPAPVAVAR